jgi:hypothetical protein
MTDNTTASPGSRPSPATAADVTRGTPVPGFPVVLGAEAWWQETRPEQGGRTTILRRTADGTVTDVLAEPWNATTRVHEYGGRSFLPVADGSETGTATTVVFS